MLNFCAMKKPLIQLLCQGLIGFLLFMQMAVAAYACAGLSDVKGIGTAHSMQQQVTNMNSPQKSGMDYAAANLCIVHCQSEHQSAGHFQVPPVHWTIPSGFYVLQQVLPAFVVGGLPPLSNDSHRAAFLPHAILHCCFRI